MRFDRWIGLAVAAGLLSGCHMFSRLTPSCHTPQEYQRSRQMAPLNVPEGLDNPNTQGALVIPPVDVAPPPPGPKDACLDVPPKYKAAPSGKAATDAASG